MNYCFLWKNIFPYEYSFEEIQEWCIKEYPDEVEITYEKTEYDLHKRIGFILFPNDPPEIIPCTMVQLKTYVEYNVFCKVTNREFEEHCDAVMCYTLIREFKRIIAKTEIAAVAIALKWNITPVDQDSK